MPLFFLIVGVALVWSAILGTQSQLFALLKGDVTGSNNFGVWILAIATVGALGYVPGLRTISNGLLVLVVVVIMLEANKTSGSGFFANFSKAVQAA